MTWELTGLSGWRSGLALAGFVACELGRSYLAGMASLVAAMTIRRACPASAGQAAGRGAWRGR
jgi:hypothetical protein